MFIINKLHNFFESELNLSELNSAKLKYSLEIIFGEFLKIIVLLVLFSILGQGVDFIYSFLAILTVRLFTGGLHFNTYSGCIIFSIIFFYISIFLKNHIIINKFVLIILFMFSMITVISLAPVYGNYRPNYSYKKRQHFKLMGIVVALIHFLMYFFAQKNPYLINSVWVLTLQSLQLLVAKGLSFMKKRKSILEKSVHVLGQLLILLAPFTLANTASMVLWGEPKCPDILKDSISTK